MTPDRIIDVVYIAGAGRSGSTIVDRVLGSAADAASLAEIRPLWKHGFDADLLCSCGIRFSECAFWASVLGEHHHDLSWADDVLRLHKRVDRSRFFPMLWAGRETADVHRYRDILSSLYNRLADELGVTTLIDSSKVPTRALLLSGVPGIRVSVLHLVRDPRAVVYAWQKQMSDPAREATRQRHSLAWVATFWTMRNALAATLKHRMPYGRMRYEDFAADPQAALARLRAQSPDLVLPAPSFLDTRDGPTVDLPPLHSVGGSTSRFNSGPTTIRHDGAWRDKLSPTQARLTKALTSPLFFRYGYR